MKCWNQGLGAAEIDLLGNSRSWAPPLGSVLILITDDSLALLIGINIFPEKNVGVQSTGNYRAFPGHC